MVGQRLLFRIGTVLTLVLGLAAVVAVLAAPPTRAATVRYMVTDLGIIGDASQVRATAISNNGYWIAGELTIPSGPYAGTHVFRWNTDSGMTDLGTLAGPGFSATATGVSDTGMVVGTGDTPFGQHAFVSEGDMLQDLGTLLTGGGAISTASSVHAYGVSPDGTVVGDAYITARVGPVGDTTTIPASHAFRWRPGATSLTDLGTMGGAWNSTAFGISSSGTIVGTGGRSADDSASYALLFEGAWSNLPLCGSYGTFGMGINTQGEVVATAYTYSNVHGGNYACLYTDGAWINLGSLGNQAQTMGTGINDESQVIGVSLNPILGWRPFLWQDGAMADLNTLIAADSGWTLEWASAINNEGQIVGWGTVSPNGPRRAFLLTPVPFDTTAPVITPTISGTLGTDGWYTSDIQVSWSVADTESSVSARTGCDPVAIVNDTAGMTLICSATSAGGSATESVTIKRDSTAPTVTGTPTRAPDQNGWYNHAVAFDWSGNSDDLSGIASCDPATSYTGPDAASTSLSGSCVDGAGNIGVGTVASFNYDATAPTLNPNVSPNPILAHGSATASAGAVDGRSGIASQSCSVLDTDSVGAKSVQCSASDTAGNSASAGASYHVTYGLRLVGDTPESKPKNGSIQVTLQLVDAAGVNVSSPAVTVTVARVERPDGTTVATLNDRADYKSGGPTGANYAYKTKDQSLASGSYRLVITISGDPIEHIIPATVK